MTSEIPTSRLIHGDCIVEMAKLPANSVDFIFADPPYLLSNGGFSVASGKQVSVNKGEWDVSKGFESDVEFHRAWIEQALRLLKPNGTIAISGTPHSTYKVGFVLESLEAKILNEIVWYKPNAAPNLGLRNLAASHETVIWASKSAKSKHTFNYEVLKYGDYPKDFIKNPGKQMRDVWAISTPGPSEKKHGKHPTQKPLALLERLIVMATNQGDLVLDPFLGSGTTGVAALALNRDFIGMELEADYLVLAKERTRG